jgi:hypothetical protein
LLMQGQRQQQVALQFGVNVSDMHEWEENECKVAQSVSHSFWVNVAIKIAYLS